MTITKLHYYQHSGRVSFYTTKPLLAIFPFFFFLTAAPNQNDSCVLELHFPEGL